MPAADTVLLPLCVGLALLGIVVTGIAWRRGNRGRVLQGLSVALAPVALYLSGLLPLIWNAVDALVSWGSRVVMSPPVWFGLGLLGLCIVLWVVGSVVARRATTRRRAAAVSPTPGRPAVAAPGQPSRPAAAAAQKRGSAQKSAPTQKGAPAQQPPVDDDMAEIEALLKSRGID